MILIFAGVVLTVGKASSVAGDTLGSAWRTLVSALFFALLSACTAAAVVRGGLHSLRHRVAHRLENAASWMDSVKSNGKS